MNGFVMPSEALDLDGTCEVKGTFKNVISHMLIFKKFLYALRGGDDMDYNIGRWPLCHSSISVQVVRSYVAN